MVQPFSGNFNNITGATASSYNVQNLLQKTYFKAIVTASTCPVSSAIATIKINPLPVINITAANLQDVSSQKLTASGQVNSFTWFNFVKPNDTIAIGSYINVSPYYTTTYKAQGYSSLGCLGFDTITIEGPNFAVLKNKIDGSFYQPVDNKLYFKFDGEYIDDILKFQIQRYDRSVVNGCTVKRLKADMQNETALKNYGDNRYLIDLTNCIPNQLDQYYTIEVINEKEEKFYLRFKK